jgi:hypothetical protein
VHATLRSQIRLMNASNRTTDAFKPQVSCPVPGPILGRRRSRTTTLSSFTLTLAAPSATKRSKKA